MPSKVKIEEPIVRVQAEGLKSWTVGCTPEWERVAMS